jgi:hypothetical protein
MLFSKPLFSCSCGDPWQRKRCTQCWTRQSLNSKTSTTSPPISNT